MLTTFLRRYCQRVEQSTIQSVVIRQSLAHLPLLALNSLNCADVPLRICSLTHTAKYGTVGTLALGRTALSAGRAWRKTELWVYLGIHDEIFHFEIFKNLMVILKYLKTPSLKYFLSFFNFHVKLVGNT